MRLRKVSRPFTPLFRGWGGAPALSEGKLAAIGLPAWDKAASQMFDIQSQEVMWGGRKLTLETGRIARQADGAVIATYGESVVLCAVTAAKSVKEGQDFFPLRSEEHTYELQSLMRSSYAVLSLKK